MTREEAIQKWVIPAIKNMWNEKICDEVIKSLEQEPILDKIRAEIEQLPIKTRTNWDGCCPDLYYPQIEYVDVTKNKLLSIIDKYMKED